LHSLLELEPYVPRYDRPVPSEVEGPEPAAEPPDAGDDAAHKQPRTKLPADVERNIREQLA
jgi:hypothetical protein